MYVPLRVLQRNQKKNALDEFARENNIKPESIKKAYKRFQSTDKDKSGIIDCTEFCEILQVDPSPQTEKLFQMFDKNQSGQVGSWVIGWSCLLLTFYLGSFASFCDEGCASFAYVLRLSSPVAAPLLYTYRSTYASS